MKLPTTLLFLPLVFSDLISAQRHDLFSVLGQLPSCAISCLTTAIIESPCEFTNQTCICANAPLQSRAEACILQTCTVQEGLNTKNTTMAICNVPPRSSVTKFRVINLIFIIVTVTCVIARLVYKAIVSKTDLGWDDYIIFAALLVGVPMAIINHLGMTANGLGRDIWTLRPDQITNFIKSFYVMAVLYFLELALIKLSLLFFFLRIFPSRRIKQVLWATVTFDILFGVAFVLTAIFQCQPISHYWKSWDGQHQGKCMNVNAIAWSNAIVNIVLDFWMLAVPLSQVIFLKLAWKRKVGVCFMFFVGTFVTVVSILRLQSLIHFAHTRNPTWDYWAISNWSTIEINVGIICACMPAIRVIFVHFFPKVFGSTKRSTAYQYAKRDRYCQGATKVSNNLGHGDKQTISTQNEDNDEMQLVHMHETHPKGLK